MRATLSCIVLTCSLGYSCPASLACVEQNKAAEQKGTDQHTAYALLHLAYREPRLLNGGDNVPALERTEFEVFRRTQSVLIRSRLVLNAALRQPNIAGLELVKQHKADPIGWLAFALDVSFPDDCEIMRVSLRGSDPTELKALVNAVTDAYMSEVVDNDRKKRLERFAQLEEIHNEIEQKSRLKREQLRMLSEILWSGDASVLAVRKQLALEEVVALRKELRQVKLELIKTRVRHASLQKLTSGAEEDPVAESDVAELVESSPMVKEQHDRVAKLEELIETAERVGGDEKSPRLKSLREQLDHAVRTLEASRSRVGSAFVEKMRKQAKEKAQAAARQIDEQISVLTEQQKFLEEHLATGFEEAERTGRTSVELEFVHQDIERTNKIEGAVASELEGLRVELRARPRVSLIQAAESD